MAEEPRPAPETEPGLDLASQSLANALRLSFLVLAVVIGILVALFIGRGVFTVHPDEVAIISRFGETDAGRVKGEGVHYAWPYPFEEVARVWTRPRTLEVNTFWPTVSEQAKQEAVEKGETKETVKIYEGAENAFLLTGDLNILQARLDVRYRIRRDARGSIDKNAAVEYFNTVGVDERYEYNDVRRYEKERLLMKVVLQSAMVRAVSGLSIADAYPLGQTALSETVKGTMVEMLRELDCGLAIEQVNVIVVQPPENVKPAFDAVFGASVGSRTMVQNAVSEKNRKLIAAAGRLGIELGEVLDQWWQAKRADNQSELERLEEGISELFGREDLGGEVQTELAEARAYKTQILERTKGDAERVGRLASLLKDSPAEVKIFLDRERINVLQAVLSNCYEKYFYRPGEEGSESMLELWLNRRPERLRELRQLEETR